MARQLTLLESPPSWRLDPRTREVGRRGVAEARASLAAARAAAASQEQEAHSRPGRRRAQRSAA